MRARVRGLVRTALGLAVLGFVLARFGAEPFLRGVSRVDGEALVAASALTGVTTLAAVWRWRVVAAGLGEHVPVGEAVTAYYRSQFLNSVLPGGVLGDVHRAVVRGRQGGDLARSARAVAGERLAGQAVQLVLAVLAIVFLPWPATAFPTVLVVVLATAGVAVVVAAVLTGRLGHRWPGVALASVVVVVGHTATLLVAARAVGLPVALGPLLPVAVLILLAMSVPANVGGWGPREGAAAWLFGFAGWGAERGLEVASAYGVMALVATTPGLAVLAAERLRSRRVVLDRG